MSGQSEMAIAARERYLGVGLDYVREMARVAPELCDRISRYEELARFESRVPKEIVHLAGLGATLAQDCGPCAQIGVNLSLRDGVDADLVRAALARDGAKRLTGLQRDALAFGRAVTLGDPSAGPLRERLRDAFGDGGVVELSWTVAVAQFYPALKRGMGFARSLDAFGVTVPGDPV